MIKERFRLSYPWIKIKNEHEELLYKLSWVEDEEESKLFLFRLFLQDEQDLDFFNPEEREEVKGLLLLIMEETRKHTELIAEMVAEIKTIAEVKRES